MISRDCSNPDDTCKEISEGGDRICVPYAECEAFCEWEEFCSVDGSCQCESAYSSTFSNLSFQGVDPTEVAAANETTTASPDYGQ